MLGYIGSKKSLLPFLEEKITPCLDGGKEFADIFSGTGCVVQHFSQFCPNVLANDMEYYSYVINKAMLNSRYTPKLNDLINNLNKLEGQDGLITNHFARDRMFFTEANAKMMDAVRTEINALRTTHVIEEDEFFFLLGSFLVSVDKVANTASVYAAYLKQFKKSALKDFVLRPIHTKEDIPNGNREVHQSNALDIIKKRKFEVVYIDPPYNSRQYSANYSLLNYVALYDPDTEITGKAGIIKDYFKSSFCSKGKVLESFDNLIKDLDADTIFISYNNEGLVKEQDMRALCEKYGDVVVHVCDYRKFISQRNRPEKGVQEFLFEIHKKRALQEEP